MRRAVKYKKRRKNTKQPKISYRKKDGHHYRDYLGVMKEDPEQRVVQMDTVEGVKGGKLLQTFLWPENNLMLAYLIDSKEIKNTVSEPFEKSVNGGERTSLYYCEARHSEQKGELEKNHEYIRYVLPKGTSFDRLDQGKVDLMIDHINNTTRPGLHGSTPMKRALKTFGENTVERLGLHLIRADEICLKPELLK